MILSSLETEWKKLNSKTISIGIFELETIDFLSPLGLWYKCSSPLREKVPPEHWDRGISRKGEEVNFLQRLKFNQNWSIMKSLSNNNPIRLKIVMKVFTFPEKKNISRESFSHVQSYFNCYTWASVRLK